VAVVLQILASGFAAGAVYGLVGVGYAVVFRLLAAAIVWFEPRRALAAGIAVGLLQAVVTSAHWGSAQLGPAYRDVVPLLAGLAVLAWRARSLRVAVE
jgi:branched-subunit amino acid ABC-type transport system permease component